MIMNWEFKYIGNIYIGDFDGSIDDAIKKLQDIKDKYEKSYSDITLQTSYDENDEGDGTLSEYITILGIPLKEE